MLSVLFALFGVSSAWWCNGHMVTAMIARLELLESAPEVFDKVREVLEPLDGDLTHGLNNNFVESSCWADDLKAYGLGSTFAWHFLDHPYNKDGLLDTPVEVENIIWALDRIFHTLTTVTNEQAPFETSFMLRMLTHFLGDMHQPLHNAQLWSRQFPHGDAGGNFFKIDFKEAIHQLHALWDSGIAVMEFIVPRPLDVNGIMQIQTWANWARGNYTRADLAEDLKITDRMEWTRRAYWTAIESAYGGIEYKGVPSAEYMKKGWQIVMRQLALGGYRLADILRGFYEK